MNKKRVMGIFLSWIGLAIILISFSPSVTGFAISSSLIFRGGYFLFLGFVLAIVGMFMTTLEDEVEDEVEKAISLEQAERLSELATKVVKKIHEGNYGSLVFLDKKARIFHHLIRARWNNLYPTEKIPQNLFINVGREKIRSAKSNLEVGQLELKKRFKDKYFENKKVLIIDEVIETGKTKKFVLDLFEKTYPSSKTEYMGLSEIYGKEGMEFMFKIGKLGRIPANWKTEENPYSFFVGREKNLDEVYSQRLFTRKKVMARKLKEIGERKY